MLWIAGYLPNLAVEVFYSPLCASPANSEPKAIAITEGQRIFQVNRCAYQGGLRVGQKLATALSHAPNAVFKPRDRTAEQNALKTVLGWASQFTPQISCPSEDQFLLEISASLRLFGGHSNLNQRLTAGLKSLGFSAQWAMAPTGRGALWLSRRQDRSHQPLLTLKHLKPVLDSLHFRHIPDLHAHQALLKSWGASRLGALENLPRSGLAQRLGPEIIAKLDEAYGRRPECWAIEHPTPHFEGQISFLYRADTFEGIYFAAQRLFEQLSAWLQRRHLLSTQLQLQLEHDQPPHTVVNIETASPTRDTERWIRWLREHSARIHLPAPVYGLTLRVDRTQTNPGQAHSLFAQAPHSTEAPAVLLERLRARLGPAAIQQMRDEADLRPERSQTPCAAGAAATAPAQPHPAYSHPVWLMPEPQPLPPPHKGDRTLAGPERLECGWWDDKPIRRDYFVIENREHRLLWVFRETEHADRWYLHGFFA